MDRRSFLAWWMAGLASAACKRPAPRRLPGFAENSPEAQRHVFAPVPFMPTVQPLPIDTIVFIIKENRTYDALFGDFPGGDGNPAGATWCPDEFEAEIPHGRSIALQPRETHRRCVQRAEDVPRYHELARAFTLCDRFFSEIRGPSFPNHQMIVSGHFSEIDDPGAVDRWRCPTHCYDMPTFPEVLDRAGKSWRAYAQGVFVPTFHMFRRLDHRREIVSWSQLRADAAAGALPNVSWVYSEQRDSEHPPASLCRGEEWTVEQLEALMHSPQWPRMAIFVTWDDWGGIWDHVEPPVIETDNRGRPLRYGHRVPCLVISPWARNGYISHETHSFLSLVRFAFDTLGVKLPPGRIATAPTMVDCFDPTRVPIPPLSLSPRQCARGT